MSIVYVDPEDPSKGGVEASDVLLVRNHNYAGALDKKIHTFNQVTFEGNITLNIGKYANVSLWVEVEVNIFVATPDQHRSSVAYVYERKGGAKVGDSSFHHGISRATHVDGIAQDLVNRAVYDVFEITDPTPYKKATAKMEKNEEYDFIETYRDVDIYCDDEGRYFYVFDEDYVDFDNLQDTKNDIDYLVADFPDRFREIVKAKAEPVEYRGLQLVQSADDSNEVIICDEMEVAVGISNMGATSASSSDEPKRLVGEFLGNGHSADLPERAERSIGEKLERLDNGNNLGKLKGWANQKVKKEPNVGGWQVGEETDPNARLDFLDVDLRGAGAVIFITPKTSTWSKRKFDAHFLWNGQSIEATLFIEGRNNHYLMNYTKVSGEQKTIATEYNRNISTAEAKIVILLGWDAFLEGISKSIAPTMLDAYDLCKKWCSDNHRKGMTAEAIHKLIGCNPEAMIREYTVKGMIKTACCKEGKLYIFDETR